MFFLEKGYSCFGEETYLTRFEKAEKDISTKLKALSNEWIILDFLSFWKYFYKTEIIKTAMKQ